MNSHMILMLLAVGAAQWCAVHGDPIPDPAPTLDEINEDKDGFLWTAINDIIELKPAYEELKSESQDFVAYIDTNNPLPRVIERMKQLRDSARSAGYSELRNNLKEIVRKLGRLEQDITRARSEAVNEEGRITEAMNENDDDKQGLYDALTVAYNCENSAGGSEGYYTNNGICYKLGAEIVTFDQARVLCQELDMDLVTLDTEVKDVFIRGVLNSNGLRMSDHQNRFVYWMGARKDNANNFRWLHTNELVSDGHTNWYSGEPNNWGGNEDCLHFWVPIYWNDIPCDLPQRYICEFYRN